MFQLQTIPVLILTIFPSPLPVISGNVPRGRHSPVPGHQLHDPPVVAPVRGAAAAGDGRGRLLHGAGQAASHVA